MSVSLINDLFYIVLLFCNVNLKAQSGLSVTDSLIAQSQTGSMPLIFKPFQYELSKITVAEYNKTSETKVRNGLPNFFRKVALDSGVVKLATLEEASPVPTISIAVNRSTIYSALSRK